MHVLNFLVTFLLLTTNTALYKKWEANEALMDFLSK